MNSTTIIIGELLPWKGQWWEVIDFNPSTNHITLSKREQITGALKKEAATKKWKKNHPKAKIKKVDLVLDGAKEYLRMKGE